MVHRAQRRRNAVARNPGSRCMLSKDPAPESLEEGAADDDEISEKTAGPTYKEEEDIVEEAEEDEEDSMTERRTQRANEEDDDEDNTLSLAAMEELLKPGDRKSTRLHSSP